MTALAFFLGFYLGGLVVSLGSLVLAMRMNPIMVDEMLARPAVELAFFLTKHVLLWPIALVQYLCQYTGP